MNSQWLEDQGSVLFDSLRLDDKPLAECELALETDSGNYRLYVSYIDGGFMALAVEHVSSNGPKIWEGPDVYVNNLFNLVAYFDGVRHLEFNRESPCMPGYMCYPSIAGLIELFAKVRKIEKQQCCECEP